MIRTILVASLVLGSAAASAQSRADIERAIARAAEPPAFASQQEHCVAGAAPAQRVSYNNTPAGFATVLVAAALGAASDADDPVAVCGTSRAWKATSAGWLAAPEPPALP